MIIKILIFSVVEEEDVSFLVLMLEVPFSLFPVIFEAPKSRFLMFDFLLFEFDLQMAHFLIINFTFEKFNFL